MKLPINLKTWIDDHRDQLKPPVGNKQVFTDTKDFIVMVVGGPNARKDYHLNKTEEFFYQIEGTIVLSIVRDGKVEDIEINEGELFLLPGGIPHSPRRPKNTIGLVIEKIRAAHEEDGFLWLCESCGTKLYEETFSLDNIETQLPLVMKTFYSSIELRTCNTCGTIMNPPKV